VSTLGGIIAEAAKVYREARRGELDHTEARSLVWMLSQLRGMVETEALERIEQRLEELAAARPDSGRRLLTDYSAWRAN
jgi:hypothetical protein